MSDIAVRVEGLGKRYAVGGGAPYASLRDSVAALPRRLLGRSSGGRGRQELWVLKDVSFEVKQGEVLGVIGRNGSGKSTLLKILSRITRPTEGRAEVWGRVGSLLEVGTGFHPELTGRENIWLYGAILGLKRQEIQNRFDEIVAFSEVEAFLDTPLKHYSSGMQMRLAFSVAAHLEPEVLLVDEVLAVGDAAFQRKCLGKMEDVQKGGRTVVFVSHNMAAVERLCRRVILLDRGLLARAGSPREAIESYLREVSDERVSWSRQTTPCAPAFFEAVEVRCEDGGRVVPFHTAGGAVVDVVFSLLKELPSLELSVDLLDELEQVLAVTIPADAGVTLPRERGRYRMSLRFPQGVFLARRYGLRANLYLPTLGSVDRAPLLWFTVAARQAVNTSSPLRREGQLFVPCQWELVRQGDHEARDGPE